MTLDIKTFVICSGFFLGIWGFSMLLYSILLKFSRNLGIRNKGDIIRWATTSKPALGGIAFYIVFLISFIFENIVFEDPSILKDLGALGLLGAGSLAFLMGLADDAYNTRPILKFFIQVMCAALLIFTGTYIDLFENQFWNQLLTVLWVIGIMNSINMLDNMDGISTLTSLFIFLIAAIYIALHNDLKSPDFIILLGLLASLFAFLFFNWSPSKMFMGDTGSQFLGIILAYIGIKYFWNATLLNGDSAFSMRIWVFLIGFLLPITDTTIVTLNRILRGKSPFIGGRDHTTHNLVYFGLSDSQVALSFSAISMINLLFCFFIFRFIEEWTTLLSILCGVYCLSIFASLFYLCIKQRDLYSDSPE